MRLPRKYHRLLNYVGLLLGVAGLGCWLWQGQGLGLGRWSQEQHPQGYRPQEQLQLLLQQDHVLVNVGSRDCLHVLGRWQRCFGEETLLPVHASSSYSNSKLPTARVPINKDLRGSWGFQWCGRSQYYFYDVVSKHDLVRFLHDTSRSSSSHKTITAFESITTSQTHAAANGFSCNFSDKLYLKPLELDIAALSNSNKAHLLDSLVSDISILFGDDCKDPRPQWHLLRDPPLETRYRFNSYITFRVGSSSRSSSSSASASAPDVVLTPTLQGLFKIVQLADLHMGVGPGECIDEFPRHDNADPQQLHCQADPKTLQFISKVLDIEKPQLVVFTGDQVMGDRSIQDSESTLLKAIAPVVERNIPWAMVWGNHDDEGSLDRWQLSQFVLTLPLNIFQISPHDTRDNTFGVGNYFKQVLNAKLNPVATFYFLDSHKYSTTGKIYPGYDWIKEPQWDYMRKLYHSHLNSDIYHRDNHLSMAFFHIPLPEYLNLQSSRNPNEQNTIVGQFKEGVTAPKYNSGGLATLQQMGVQITSCGHDHCNDYCLQDDSTQDKIWLCFGGSAGEGAYAGYGGTERRIRVFELDTVNHIIKSWKRLNGSPNSPFDQQILVT